MKHTLKTYIAEQMQEMGIEDKYGKYYSAQEIIDEFDEIIKTLDKGELLELIVDFTELEYEQSK